MAMSRKDYELIADALKRAKPNLRDRSIDRDLAVWEMTVTSVAVKLAAYNARFDRTKFEHACGIDQVSP